MNSWIVTMLSFRARNTSVWETTASQPFAGGLRDELVSWGPYFLRHDGVRTVLRSPAVEQMGMALIELPTSTRTHDELISRVRVHGQPPQHRRTPGEESTVG